MTILFGVFLLTLLVITALAIVRTSHLFAAVILTSIFSLLAHMLERVRTGLVWFHMDLSYHKG